MDTIFYNGNIHTVDSAIPKAQAVAVKDGIIMAVGGDKEILAMATEDTKTIDLRGRLMLPGFNDTHMHLVSYGNSLEKANLGSAKSKEDIINEGRDFYAKNPSIKWLEGRGWNNDNWDDNSLPTRYDLDKITTDIPVSYMRACGHVMITNSMALEVMGMTGKVEQIPGGQIDVDENGEPLGIFKESALDLVTDALPELSVDDIKRMIINGGKDLQRCGITSVQSDDFEAVPDKDYPKVMVAYKQLCEEDKMPVRVFEQCFVSPFDSFKEFLDNGYKTGVGNMFFKIGPYKILADGSLGGRTAYMTKPYADDPTTEGIAIYTQEELDEMIATAHNAGMTVAVHNIGDGIMHMTFNAIEKAMLNNPKADMRHSIIHCQITDEELLRKYRDLNINAHIQPTFLDYDLHIVEDRVGKELASTSYNWKTLIDLGVHVSGGSDSPVDTFNVMKGIYSAVTRQDLSGNPKDGWLPEQKITVDQAVYMYTQAGSYPSFEENVKGSIRVGKYADFTVLERDIFNIPQDEIKDVNVEMTVLNGKVVFAQ